MPTVGRSSSEQSVLGQNWGGLTPTLLTAVWVPLYVTLDSCLGMAEQGLAGRGCLRMIGAMPQDAARTGQPSAQASLPRPGGLKALGDLFLIKKDHKRRYKPWRLQTHHFCLCSGYRYAFIFKLGLGFVDISAVVFP